MSGLRCTAALRLWASSGAVGFGLDALPRALSAGQGLGMRLASTSAAGPPANGAGDGAVAPDDLALARQLLEKAATSLTKDFERRVLHSLSAVQRILGGDREAARRAVLRSNGLLVNNADMLHRNFQYVMGLGLSQGEARGLLHSAPQVLCYSAHTLHAKLRRFEEEHGLSPREVLLKHPQSLSASLTHVHAAAAEGNDEEGGESEGEAHSAGAK